MALKEFCLVREVLDKQLVDCQEVRMGRVDGIVIEIRDGAPPRVDHFELGFTVLAERLNARFGAWFARARKRWSVRRNARYLVPWSLVTQVTEHHVMLDVDAEKTPAFEWERWLSKHIVTKLPGGAEE